MARGFIFASQLCRRYGMPLPRSGKKTDVPSHGSALATLLAHGGVQFMHIGCNWPSESGAPLAVSNGRLVFHLPAYAPASFLLHPPTFPGS
jgi:hypothetical protein